MTDSVLTDTKHPEGHTETHWVNSRWYHALDISCALLAAALWYLSDGRLGPWPVAIAAVPWVGRIANGRSPIKSTRLDLPLAGFLLTAGLAGIIGYNPEIGWAKFWLIVGAVILYYAIAGQPQDNVWPIVTGLSLFGGAVAFYFLLTHDWTAIPAKIALIHSSALKWMAIRPGFLDGFHRLHPNVAGGILALLFPFSLAVSLRSVRRGQVLPLVVSLAAVLTIAIGLLFTTSRGAWIALVGGMFAWGIWVLAGPIHRYFIISRRKALLLCFGLVAGIGLTYLLLIPGGLGGIIDRLPGPASAESRLEINQDAIDLIGDFPYTGGGLGSFDGLYSQYIRVIPQHYLIHGHSLFLNVGVEQGIFALGLLLTMFAVVFWWLSDLRHSAVRRTFRGLHLLAGSTFAALVITILHGLVEDPLYGSRGLLLLWVPFGFAAFLFPRRGKAFTWLAPTNRLSLAILAVTILILATVTIYFRQTLLSAWQSNRGALIMAQIELADYPTDFWTTGDESALLGGAVEHFNRALLFNPDNRTARYRLGLIDLNKREFAKSVNSLSIAHTLDPDHRGIQKSLGYATIWAGDPFRGAQLLSEIPEAADELGVYSWWWSTQGREDLGRQATEANQIIKAQPTAP